MFRRFISSYFVLSYALFVLPMYSAEIVPHAEITLPQPEAYYSGKMTENMQQEMVALSYYQKGVSLALPSALSTISASMKDPYVLLIASAGTCLAYVMTGASPEPIASPEKLLGLTQENMFV